MPTDAKIPYRAPSPDVSAFNCPHCQAYARQHWGPVQSSFSAKEQIKDLQQCWCTHCGRYSLWRLGQMLYPPANTAPLPHPDLPDDVKADYEEARSILPNSPRGAAALLRLAIQKLCKHLGQEGQNINSDIKSLVQKGLPEKVQQSLDIVRVVGNNAVHPGQLDLKDDADTANCMFELVNLIVDVMITQPKHVDDLYQSVVPESQREAIAKRDATGAAG